MGAVSLRFWILATALLAMILGAALFDARPAKTDRLETVYAMPSNASGMGSMGMGMPGMLNCNHSSADGMSGCTMQGHCSYSGQITGITGLDIVTAAPHREFSAASPPFPALGRSLAPNPAPPKPHSILS